MTTTNIITLIGAGVGAGFASGLLGVGGAFIMTPVQYMVFTSMGLPDDTAIKLAIGTGLAVFLPTAASGAWRHHRMGAVQWKIALVIGACGLACAYAGANLAVSLSGETLRIIFGTVVLGSGVRMLVYKPPETHGEHRTNPWFWVACGVPTGLISGLTGLGGGVIAVPLLIMLLRFSTHQAVATSLGAITITGIGGLVRYITGGQGVSGLPPHSIGYLNLQAWALLAASLSRTWVPWHIRSSCRPPTVSVPNSSWPS